MRSKKLSGRIAYFDTLRGLAIFGVVAIHSTGAGLQFSDNNFNFHFTILWRQLLNFSVPMFIVISGYFLAQKNIVNFGEYWPFVKKQIPKVYVPLFFWSVVWALFSICILNKSVIGETYKILIFQSIGPYYFIALIIQYYIIAPVIYRIANFKGLVASVLMSVAMALLILYLRYYAKVNLSLIIYAGNFVTWIMFFVLGTYIARGGMVRISNKFAVISILFFYLLSCAESYALYLAFDNAGDAVTAVKASSFVYSFFVIVFLFNNLDIFKSIILNEIGRVSFGIYLIHMFFIMFVSRLLRVVFPSIQNIQPLYQLASISFVLMSCFLCIYISNKVLSFDHNRLIGFR